jgi:hypothetical protein
MGRPWSDGFLSERSNERGCHVVGLNDDALAEEMEISNGLLHSLLAFEHRVGTSAGSFGGAMF